MKRFLQSWTINTLSVLLAVYFVPGISFPDKSLWSPFLAALVLGVLNALLRPILIFFALPLLIYSLGLFKLVINAGVLYCVGLLLKGHFEVKTFRAAFLGAAVILIVSTVLNIITGVGRAAVRFERHRRPPDQGGKGPVIDV